MKLIKKACYKFEMLTMSPLSIGAYAFENTDHDIAIYKSNHEYFVPSSSIVGCLFSNDDESKKLFRIVDDEKNLKESPLFVSDGIFDVGVKTGIRKGNNITNKSTFSIEIIQNNQKWSFIIEYSFYDGNTDTIEELDELINDIVCKINAGIYRIGYRQNRGFGKQKVLKVLRKVFDKTNYVDYLDCDYSKFKEMIIKNNYSNQETSLIMKIKAVSPVGARDYFTNDGDISTSFIKSVSNSNNVFAVIPGTSINGALKERIKFIASELKLPLKYNDDNFLNKFNHVIDEIYIEGQENKHVRNSIDRFSGTASKKYLINESFLVPNDKNEAIINIRFKHQDKVIIGLYYLALKDLANGYITLGGNSTLGRGFFKNESEIEIISNCNLKEKDLAMAISNLIGG